MRFIRSIGAALAYFTILPVGKLAQGPAPDAEALSALPLIGMLLGAGVGGLAILARPYVSWSLLVALVISGVWILTGALHVDGYLDCADALFAPVSVERRHEILKDPRHGTFAVVALVILTLLWWSTMQSIAIFSNLQLFALLIWSGGLARCAAVVNAMVFPYARAGAITRTFTSRPNLIALVLSLGALEAVAWTIAPLTLAIAPLAIGISLLAGRWMAGRLDGGLVGDCYGAIIAGLEPVLIFAAVLFVR